ncbi:hypothetical protein KRR40_26700 [Niabella defluvii]|nr:hypothetical protein KRR40_26700 [Niabella sp. I65]
MDIGYASEMYEYLLLIDDCQNNAAMRHIKLLKQIFDRAVDKGYQLKNPVHKYRCKYIDPMPKPLVLEAVLKLIETDFNEQLNEYRDMFIFMCFTGYHYEELRRLEISDIFIGQDGKKWIATKRAKTEDNGAYMNRYPCYLLLLK